MKYNYVPQSQMVVVHFDFPVEFEQAEFDAHFFNRLPMIDPDGKWVGVLCKMNEWNRYLQGAVHSVSSSPDAFAHMANEALAFRKFQLEIQATPFYRPDLQDLTHND